MTPEIYESLSAAILTADLERCLSECLRHGLAAEGEQFSCDEIRDMLLDFSAALSAAEAEATRRTLAGA